MIASIILLLYTATPHSHETHSYMQLLRSEDEKIIEEIQGVDVGKMTEENAMEFFYRVIASPQQGVCRSLKRVGGKWTDDIGVDGDKFVCMDTFQDGSECVVYSFGIADDWTFE